MPTAAISTPTRILTSWLQAAQRATTIRAYRWQVQPVARELARLLEAGAVAGQLNLAEKLRSDRRDDLLGGLAALQVNLDDADGAVTRHLASQLEADSSGLIARLGQAAEGLQRVVGGEREPFRAVTRAARRNGRIITHALDRLLLEPAEGRAQSAATYKYDASRVEGHFFMHPGSSTTPKSTEGEAAYEETHRAELEKLHRFVAEQLALHEGDGSEASHASVAYQTTREAVVRALDPYRQNWDRMIDSLRELGDPPSFAKVSQAFWERDQAIRRRIGPEAQRIGPWEYDLIRSHREQAAKGVRGELTRQDLTRYTMREWSYLLQKIVARYHELESAESNSDRLSEMERLKNLRFELESVYMRIAGGERPFEGDQRYLEEARAEFISFLNTDLSDPSFDEINERDRAARETYDDYSRTMHKRNLAVAKLLLERFNEDQKIIDKIDRLEHRWQEARYRELVEKAGRRMELNDSQMAKFETALGRYQDATADYLAYAKRMMDEDPQAREHTRNSKYRVVFVRLWEMHEAVKEILREVKDPDAEKLQILTFVYKTQAQLIAKGPKGMEALEPLIDTTLALKPALDHERDGIYSLQRLSEISGREWGLNLVTRYTRNVHIVGADQLFGYFGQGVRSETTMMEGSLQLYPEGADQIAPEMFARRGGVLDSMHLGQFEFAVTEAIPYVTGLPHAPILAQSGINMFPIANTFIGGINRGGRHYLGGGAYVNRTRDPKRRAMENFILEVHVEMGNLMNIFSNGTRDIESPLPSPFANLEKHPEALHLPDYHPSRYSTAMTIALAQNTGAPVVPVAYDLGKVYPEPSMPMPSGWRWGDFIRNPRRTIKPYAGFWQAWTMFPYIRPGEESVTVAYGDPIPAQSFIREEDLRGAGFGDLLDSWATLSEKERRKKIKWALLQLNYAVVRGAQERAGFTATAGIHGSA